MKKILISLLHMKGRNVLTFLFMFLKKIAAFVDLVESRAREKFVPRHLTHYLSISIWPASSKAKKAFGRLYRFFFFIFVRTLLRKKYQSTKGGKYYMYSI